LSRFSNLSKDATRVDLGPFLVFSFLSALQVFLCSCHELMSCLPHSNRRSGLVKIKKIVRPKPIFVLYMLVYRTWFEFRYETYYIVSGLSKLECRGVTQHHTGFIQTWKIQGNLENTWNLNCSGKYMENPTFLSKYMENTGNQFCFNYKSCRFSIHFK